MMSWTDQAAGQSTTMPHWRLCGGVSYLFHDRFDGVADTDLTAHTPDEDDAGNGWVHQNGWHKLDGSGGTYPDITAGIPRSMSVVDTEVSDVKITDTFETDADGLYNVGPYARSQDKDNNWQADVVPSLDRFRLGQRAAGVWVERDFASVAVAASTEYTIEFTVDGTSLSALLDGGNAISFVSATLQSETNHGIGTHNQANVTHKEITVEAV